MRSDVTFFHFRHFVEHEFRAQDQRLHPESAGGAPKQTVCLIVINGCHMRGMWSFQERGPATKITLSFPIQPQCRLKCRLLTATGKYQSWILTCHQWRWQCADHHDKKQQSEPIGHLLLQQIWVREEERDAWREDKRSVKQHELENGIILRRNA